MQLTGRLKQLAAWVPRGAVAADIGTDHALLPMYLVAEDICPRVIATEAAPGPLQRAAANLAAFPRRERIELRLADGLAALGPGEADPLVLAGLGAGTMKAIFEAGPAVLAAGPRLLLQPMNGAGALRQWLYGRGWHLAAEKLVAEGRRLYVVMAFDPGAGEAADPLDLVIGPGLIAGRDPLLPEYLARMAKSLAVLRVRLAAAESPAAAGRAREVDRLLTRIGEVERWLSGEKT